MIVFISWRRMMVNKKSYDIKNITSAQIRAARALLRWSAEELAEKAILGVATIRRAEATDGPIQMTASNLASVRAALENAGVEFIPANGSGPGVRLRK
jgi:ribosome-binding protein aMBF1 (putative translation factor)